MTIFSAFHISSQNESAADDNKEVHDQSLGAGFMRQVSNESPATQQLKRKKTQEEHVAELKKSISADDDLDAVAAAPDDGILTTVWFNFAVNFMTLLNAAQMGFEAEYPQYEHVWTTSELVFTSGFTVEMCIKLYILRWRYFQDRANWLDGSLTVLGILDSFILSFLPSGDSANLQSLSILRILRLARLARILKLVRAFKPVVLVIQGVMKTFATLCYVFVLLLVIFYVFAIFFTEHLGKKVDSDMYPGFSTDEEVIDSQSYMVNFNPHAYFGSMILSMITLFNMASLAEWHEIIRPVALKQPAFVVVFVGFGMLVAFGVMNVMIGLIVDEVITESKKMDDAFRHTLMEEKMKTLEKVQELLNDMDENNDGTVDVHELKAAMEKSPEFKALLKSINLPSAWSAKELLHMLDNNCDGVLQNAEFTTGFFRLLESDHFQQICIMQTGINEVKHMVKSANEINRARLLTIEADLRSVKTALCLATDSRRHPARDRLDRQTTASTSEGGLQCSSGQKEHIVTEISNCKVTRYTDVFHSELSEMIDEISHTQLVDTLDVAYTVMRESFEKQLAALKPSLEMQLSQKGSSLTEAIETKCKTTMCCLDDTSRPLRLAKLPIHATALPAKASDLHAGYRLDSLNPAEDNAPLDVPDGKSNSTAVLADSQCDGSETSITHHTI